MRSALAMTFICGLAALAWASDAGSRPAVTEWEDVQPTKLWRAIAAGKASASGRNPRGYRQVELTVTNKGKKRIVVDTGGSHLRPRRRGSCQRLGLGPPVVAAAAETGEKGQVLLRLEPGEKRTLLMNTVCLDAGRAGPNTHRFEGVAAALPPVREKVLRWWIDHPETPQHYVNSAIWRYRSKVIVGPMSSADRRPEKVRIAAAHGGLYYQLKNKELTSLDADGVRRILGSQIELIFPTDEALYAVMPGDDLAPDLWRFAPTGENPWGFVTDLDPETELLGVVPTGDGDLVLLTSKNVSLYSHSANATETLFDVKTDRFLSARRTRSGKIDVTTRDPGTQGKNVIGAQSAGHFEIWRIDPARGNHEMIERFWNVSAIRAGRAGIFGLSHKGVLRRVTKGKFKDTSSPDSYRSLVAVGKDVVWVMDGGGRLIASSPKTGRRLFRVDIEVSKESWFSLDAVTGDLVYPTRKGFGRISGTDGTVTEVAEMPDPPETSQTETSQPESPADDSPDEETPERATDSE